MKITSNRLHSPKGRATLTREWLRMLSEQGVDPLKLEQQLPERNTSLRSLIERTRNSWHARKGGYDFSHEVKESMSGCLACKACSTQCPIKIDVPAFRSRFLQLYHTRYLRPARDHLMANVELYAPLMAKTPKMFNFFMRQSWVQKLSEKHIGLVDLPLLSSPSLKQHLVGHRSANTTLEQLERFTPAQRAKTVLVVQDPFTSFYDAKVVADFIKLADKLGFEPVVLPFSPNGKAQHVKGFLKRFARTASKTSEVLNRISELGIPMVGVDPALVLCYRDEYQQTLGEARGDFRVQLVHEWLQGVLENPAASDTQGESWYLFGHCTETTALPTSTGQWSDIFAHFGAKLESVSVGCCGMAGTYGHETLNHANSRGIYALSWQQSIQRLPQQRCLSTGYSCRSQVKRIEGQAIRHPLQALLEIMG